MSTLSSFFPIAKRCLLLAVSPSSLRLVMQHFDSSPGGPLRSAVYWPKGNRGGGALLVELQSEERLTNLLANPSLSGLPTLYLPHRGTPFPPVRCLSDPSIWSGAKFKQSGKASVPDGLDLHELHQITTAQKEFPDRLVLQPPTISRTLLVQALLTCSSFDEQTNLLFRSMSVTSSDLLARAVFVQNLTTCMRRSWPDIDFVVHGSHANGLICRTSDLDLLMVPGDIRMLPQPLGGDSGYAKQAHHLRVLRSFMRSADPLARLQSNLLQSRFNLLHISVVPMLGIPADICFPIQPIELLQRVSSLYDRLNTVYAPRIPVIMLIIKHLARLAGLIQSGPSQYFTSFKLYALLLHYLQVNGFAPALNHLMAEEELPPPLSSSCPLSRRQEISWPEQSVWPDSTAALLTDFFCYLVGLKPTLVTLCLASGRLLPRQAAQNNRFLDVPNPFKLGWNILHGIGRSEWSSFLSWIQRLQPFLNRAEHLAHGEVSIEGASSVAGIHSNKLAMAHLVRSKMESPIWGIPAMESIQLRSNCIKEHENKLIF